MLRHVWLFFGIIIITFLFLTLHNYIIEVLAKDYVPDFTINTENRPRMYF